MRFGKYRYYLTSIWTLMTGFTQPAKIAAIFLGRSSSLPAEVRLRKAGWRFKVRSAMDIWIIKETCLDHDYLWGSPLEPDWRVVDIGAGLGDFAIFAAKHCPEGVVHAYEPLPESFALLVQNLQLNEINNVKAFQAAASARGGTVKVAGPSMPGDGAATSTRFVPAAGHGAVPAVDLPALLDRLPGGQCDFMKIDCEGCEFDLLLGSSPQTLARIERLTLEYHVDVDGSTPAELATYLRHCGFRVRTKPNPVHDDLGFLYAARR